MLQNQHLNKQIPVPLYFQLEQLLRDEIETGAYPPGSLIPTEKELIEHFGVSRTTVRQAIHDLVQEGLLYRTKSKGTFVALPKVSQHFIHSFLPYQDDVRNNGATPATDVLDLRVTTLPVELSVEAAGLGTSVIYLYRKRYVDGEPFVRVKTYLPYTACRFLLQHDLSNESLYELLSQHSETKPTRIVRSCEIQSADQEDARILGVKRGQPIHYFITKSYNSDGKLIEYSIARYRGDRSRFLVEITR